MVLVAVEIAWLILSSLIALVFFALLVDARADLRVARGESRLEVVARRDLWTYALLEAMQLVFAAVAVVVLLTDPSPVARLITIGLLFGGQVMMLVAALWRWWERKRGLKAQADQIQATADDTNTRVREMQKRGLADQPEEEADREEGRKHRNSE